jgi:beta-lactamase class A
MRFLSAVLLALLGCASAAGAQQGDSLALRRELEGLMRGYPGAAGVSVRNLTTGEAVSIRGGETFPSASLIKVGVLVTLLDEARLGHLTLDERIGMIGRDRVEGDGVLQYMGSGLNLSLSDAAWLMITISDNTATNLILDRIDIRTMWTKMESLGLPHSKIHSKTFKRPTSLAPDSSVKYGLGVTTPDEMVQLFSLLNAGRAVSPALDSLALRMLLANQDHSKLVRWLPEELAVAHKTGEVDASRNDCGILYTPAAPVAVCVMTRENPFHDYLPDNPANLLMARIGRAVFRHFNPTVQLPPEPAR